MALIKCKECGEKVSNKAEKCPSCGAKVPRKSKTGLLLIVLIALIVLGSQVSNIDPPPSATASIKPPQKAVSKAAPAKPAEKPLDPQLPGWTTRNSRDEMSGEYSYFAHSPAAFALKPMSFPYNNVRAWLGFGCKGKSQWAYIGFSEAPNLSNDKTETGYDKIRTRIKWDDQVQDTTFTQEWGDKFLNFLFDDEAIEMMQKSNHFTVELQWYGQQTSHFKMSLRGSSAAIKRAMDSCSRA